MKRNSLKQVAVVALGCVLLLVGGCKSIEGSALIRPVTITSHGVNAVSVWHEIATTTINIPPAASGTPEERQPNFAFDLATLHLAMYEAVNAIAQTHQPYAFRPNTASVGASMDAAANAAAYGVLKGLFPARATVYQSTYNFLLATIPEGDAKASGIAIGTEVARGILALRANDGRDTPLPAYIPGTAPGKFRGVNPTNRFYAFVKPFAMTSAAQFRVAGPPPLDSGAYATDFNETRTVGGAMNSLRSAAQTEVARFHTEPPPTAWPRISRQFATSQRHLADNARLMALIWVAQADALIACFESKYHFEFWRPTSAITLADIDANAATAVDANWAPAVPTPNHPEYPAAHSCQSAAAVEAVRGFFGTNQVRFNLDSTVPGTIVHRFTTTDEVVNEVQAARIHGGMHFRTATEHGAALGVKVARWAAAHHFQKRD